MGRETANKGFAWIVAVFGLAAAMTIGFTGAAGAAPADRAGDPVVLKGSQVAGVLGKAPGSIVAYRWEGGWKQIPVQIDERHTISARTMYPTPPPAYVNGVATFDIELYADAKTRSGADKDITFDSDDELVFMGGDAGQAVPAGTAAPAGVIPGGTAVTVDDPVAGGNGYVYLFEANGTPDQSAGKSYVDYDFKLTRLTEGQTLIRNYGYANSNNPEDSTVKTANYTLHSGDRWIEDGLQVTAGNANGVNIMDREAVSAGGLDKCSRNEYTFSGNWDRGGDTDEGTYVAIKNGPVRAIRSFMGANSGPYVQKDHKYYGEFEDTTIFLRVHALPHMYVWTDYSQAATGMTFRDQKNRSGVPVDGVPDTIDPATTADFQEGKYLWQQVTGPQGSLTTMTTSVTDIENPDFTTYYLDNSNPTGSHERQCGGNLNDGKAYGASGFGIRGNVPNTDPIYAPPTNPANNLFVNRVRYFGAPGATTDVADALTSRVEKPLTGSAADAGLPAPKAATTKLRVTPIKRAVRAKAKSKRKVQVGFRIRNAGKAPSRATRICVTGKRLRGLGCRSIGNLAAGKSRVVRFGLRLKGNARKGNRLVVTATVKSKTAKAAKARAAVRVR